MALDKDTKKSNTKKKVVHKRLTDNAEKWQKEVNDCRQQGRDIAKVEKQRDALH